MSKSPPQLGDIPHSRQQTDAAVPSVNPAKSELLQQLQQRAEIVLADLERGVSQRKDTQFQYSEPVGTPDITPLDSRDVAGLWERWDSLLPPTVSPPPRPPFHIQSLREAIGHVGGFLEALRAVNIPSQSSAESVEQLAASGTVTGRNGRELRECAPLVENQLPYQPNPLPAGRNPYLTLQHILHELFWQAACARQGQDVVQHINPTTDQWDESEARARRYSAGWGIPFATFDPLLTDAKRTLRELAQVAAGNTSVPFSALDSRYPLLEERLRELANSIPLVQLYGPIPPAVRNWLTASYLADPTPGQWQLTDNAEPEPVVFMRYEDFAGFLVSTGVELLPNLDDWKNAGWIADVMVDLTPTDDPSDSLHRSLTRLNLPAGRHRLVGIRRTILDAPTARDRSSSGESGAMGGLPTGKVPGVVSLNVLRVHLEMAGHPDWRERFESWPEVPFLRLRCVELFPGQLFSSATIELLIAWFQERGLTPDQARYLPLSEAVRRLSPQQATGTGGVATGLTTAPPSQSNPSLLDQAKQFLAEKDREEEARRVVMRLMPYILFPPNGPFGSPTGSPSAKPATATADPPPTMPVPLPTGTKNSEGENPPAAIASDGPFDADGFSFAGVEVRFGKAGKQYRLVMAMWDATKNRPASARPVQEVISEVWGEDNDTEDSTFRQLCADTRRRFESANFPLGITILNGNVQLTRL